MAVKVKGQTYYDIEEIYKIIDMSRNILTQTIRRPRHNGDKNDPTPTLQEDNKHASSVLTKRETEVLTLVSRGYYNKEIAFRLGISEQTVKNHISSILQKLDAGSRTEATSKAIKNGLVHID